MEDDNTPPLAQPADSAPSDSSPNDAKGGDDGIEHHLAMLIGYAWQRRIDLAIRPLAELRRHVHVKFADKDVKVKKLLATLPNRVSEISDQMFPVNFVSQSYSEIDAVVATTLPEERAKAYNIGKLKRTLREAIGEFADSAHGVLAEGTDGGFQSPLEDWQNLMLGRFAATKKIQRKLKKDARNSALQYASKRIGQLTDNVRKLARNAEDGMVKEAVRVRRRTR